MHIGGVHGRLSHRSRIIFRWPLSTVGIRGAPSGMSRNRTEVGLSSLDGRRAELSQNDWMLGGWVAARSTETAEWCIVD